MVIKDFSNSPYDSFLDYWRQLENYILEHPNPTFATVLRLGKYNYIEDSLLRLISVSYDNGGFSNRKTNETMFSIVYKLLSSWQWSEGERHDTYWFSRNKTAITELWQNNDSYITRSLDEPTSSFRSSHKLYSAYKDFIKGVLKDCLLANDLSRFKYINNSFTPVQVLHSFEENSDFVRIIKGYLEDKRSLLKSLRAVKNNDEYYKPDTFLKKWLGKEGLNLCENIDIQSDGFGFTIRLRRMGGDWEPLSDFGHGITQIVSILLNIERVLIQDGLVATENKKVQMSGRELHSPHAILAIEEPEVSLHPCFQSLLAEIFLDAATNYYNSPSFIIETHSEYLVRKTQAIIANFKKGEFEHNPFAVYYFNVNGDVYNMGFKETGSFERAFGPGFFDESARSMYQVLKREESNK